MWLSKSQGSKKPSGSGLVAVAVDKDKPSQYALKWAIENLLIKGHPVVLLHVINKPSTSSSFAAGVPGTITDALNGGSPSQHLPQQTKDLFLTFRCLCTRKDIPCLDVALEDTDTVKALVEYVNYACIEKLVLGASRGGFIRKLKHTDVPASVSKGVPDFCSVYVISKGKISTVRNATRSTTQTSPLQKQLETLVKERTEALPKHNLSLKGERPLNKPRRSHDEGSARARRLAERPFSEKLPFNDFSDCETDISFISSERTSVDRMSPMHYDIMDSSRTSPRISTSSDQSYGGSIRLGNRIGDSSFYDFSFISQDSGRTSCSSQMTINPDEGEEEIRRMKLELQQTMDLYSSACKEAACKEAVDAKQKAMELQRWREDEEKRLAMNEESAMRHSGTAQSKTSGLSLEAKSDAAKRIAQLEAQNRLGAEMKNLKEEGRENPCSSDGGGGVLRYRRYTIEEIERATDFFNASRKIGEGGYGPVFKCNLDHTPVAVKVLRPDAAQGRMQFQQEVEVLSCIRHPNLVLLLGACPEYGCLVYEHMARGSLDDRLFCRGNTPPIPWQIRFRIAAEVTTALHFLHQTKPEPLVHRDLKPANILLDQNFVSKISDVGLARLVPPNVADNVTQCLMTSTAGTFCYIDPEYQKTGMLGVKSDVYSLGILLLQLITAKPPMGLAGKVADSIRKGTFSEILDPALRNWPVEETLSIAKMAVQCAEMRRKDRPDLATVVLPELARLRDYADESFMQFMFYSKTVTCPSNPNPAQGSQELLSDPMMQMNSEYSQASSSSSQSITERTD